MRKATLLLMAIPAFFAVADRADAQFQIRKPQLGIFAGGTIPRGDFKADTEYGWNAGALFKVRLTRTFDLRVDGTYSRLGTTDIEFETASVESNGELTFGTLVAELNLGADSAAYPGDNSVSPYINAGPGYYRYKFEGTCTGACEGFIESRDQNKIGLNVGFGANVPFNGIPLFAEVRYHRFGTFFPIRQEDIERTATLLTISAGIKIR